MSAIPSFLSVREIEAVTVGKRHTTCSPAPCTHTFSRSASSSASVRLVELIRFRELSDTFPSRMMFEQRQDQVKGCILAESGGGWGGGADTEARGVVVGLGLVPGLDGPGTDILYRCAVRSGSDLVAGCYWYSPSPLWLSSVKYSSKGGEGSARVLVADSSRKKVC